MSPVAIVTRSDITGDYSYPVETTMNIKSLEEAQRLLRVGPRLEAMMLESGAIRPHDPSDTVDHLQYKMSVQDPTVQDPGSMGIDVEKGYSSKALDETDPQYLYMRRLGYSEEDGGSARQESQDAAQEFSDQSKVQIPTTELPLHQVQGMFNPATLTTSEAQTWVDTSISGETTTHTASIGQQTQALDHHSVMVLSGLSSTQGLMDQTGQVGVMSQQVVTMATGSPGEEEQEDENNDKVSVCSTETVTAPQFERKECSGIMPGLGDLVTPTIDEIPKRGRVSNKIKPLLRIKESARCHRVISSSSAPLHKGPLHSNEDRVRETLLRCYQTDSADCLYLVLGVHFHCRACKAAVREEDLIAHRYVHSCFRLISDVNISQVVLHGKFCENKKCVESKTPEAIGGFVIHMHCGHCEEILETGHSFHQHLKSTHRDVWSTCIIYHEADTAIEQCLFCRGYFDSREVLSKHMTDRHFAKFNNKEMQMYCIVCCGEDFSQVEKYRIHMALEHKILDVSLFKPQNLPLKCLECGEEATGKQNLQKHNWRSHRQSNKVCDICGAVFGSLTKLKEHETERHLEKKYSCTDCNNTFKCQMAFQKHFALVHSKNYRYFCNECSRGFAGQFQYMHHLRHHHGNQEWEAKAVKCEPGCGQSFLGDESLDKHHRVCLKYRTAVQERKEIESQ